MNLIFHLFVYTKMCSLCFGVSETQTFLTTRRRGGVHVLESVSKDGGNISFLVCLCTQ